MNGGGVTPSPTPYVDLGLPSGLLWRRWNIGAVAPEGIGLYFSWGNVEGHQEGSGYDFSQVVYNETPAADISTNLSLSEDAARAYLGAPWRMPSSAEFVELNNNCTSEWATLNGVTGRIFTSRVNGEKLFLPAAGSYDGASLLDRGNNGRYWSSTYYTAANARFLGFNDTVVVPQSSSGRHIGFPIRAVMDPT